MRREEGASQRKRGAELIEGPSPGTTTPPTRAEADTPAPDLRAWEEEAARREEGSSRRQRAAEMLAGFKRGPLGPGPCLLRVDAEAATTAERAWGKSEEEGKKGGGASRRQAGPGAAPPRCVRKTASSHEAAAGTAGLAGEHAMTGRGAARPLQSNGPGTTTALGTGRVRNHVAGPTQLMPLALRAAQLKRRGPPPHVPAASCAPFAGEARRGFGAGQMSPQGLRSGFRLPLCRLSATGTHVPDFIAGKPLMCGPCAQVNCPN